jgi:hypothetical protein
MMILSRIWYVVLSLLVGAAVYVVSLAVGQYDRRAANAMGETLKSDSQVVNWALQIDARRRLDNLLLVSVDANTTKALKAANGHDVIPPSAKDDGKKALSAFNDKLPPEYKNDAIFAVDRDGRLVAQIGYDTANAFPNFELGGYPAVFDALHGNLRDDTWVWDGKIGRVVTRPVEDEVGQPILGAIVAIRWVDQSFAKEMAKRTRTNVTFFAASKKVASASPEQQGDEFDQASFDLVLPELPKLFDDKGYKDSGRTDVSRIGSDKVGAVFMRLPGDAWEMKENGAGFAVVRQRLSIGGPLGFVTGADDKDKASVKLWLVIAVVFGGSLLGFLFSLFEHSRPQKEMVAQAKALREGKIDALQLPNFSGGLRRIAGDINMGIDRVVEKAGGQAKRPANLESILGPVPAQPAMSAFSFPLQGGDSGPPMQVPQSPGSGGRPPMPGAAPSRPGPPGLGGPGQMGGPASHMGPGANSHMGNAQMGGMQPPAPMFGAPPGTTPMGQIGPPPGSGSNPGARPMGATPAGGLPHPHPQQGPRLAAAAMTAPIGSMVGSGQALFTPAAPPGGETEDQTMVGEPPAALLAAASGQHNAAKAADENSEWMSVYEDFIRTKRQCNEPVEGLTFEKFQQTLRKNRDTLIQKHGCKRVKFSVYVKDGRASLKATPVRE